MLTEVLLSLFKRDLEKLKEELKEDLMQHILLENEILFVEPTKPGHGEQHC